MNTLIRSFRIGAFLAAVVCSAHPAAAASSTAELSMGYARSSTPLGDSDDVMGGSVSVGFAYWKAISPMISWGAEVSMDDLGVATADTYDALLGTTTREEFTTQIVRINPALRINLGATVGPSFFAQGGAGWYRVAWTYSVENEFFSAETDDKSSEFGFNIGAGLGFPVGTNTQFSIVGTYHVVPGNNLENMENTNNAQIRAALGVGI